MKMCRQKETVYVGSKLIPGSTVQHMGISDKNSPDMICNFFLFTGGINDWIYNWLNKKERVLMN